MNTYHGNPDAGDKIIFDTNCLSTVSDADEPYFDGGSAQLPILRALPDGNVRDEIDLTTGMITRRIAELLLNGTETYIKKANAGVYRFVLYPIPKRANAENKTAIFSNMLRSSMNPGNTNERNTVAINTGGQLILQMSEVAGDTTESFKAWLEEKYTNGNPLTLWYPLETPVIEHIDPALLRAHPGYTQLIQQGGFKDTDISVTPYLEDK